MIDKVRMWVLIHSYRVMIDRVFDLQITRNDSTTRRYGLAKEVFEGHYHSASSLERHALYEYAEGRDE